MSEANTPLGRAGMLILGRYFDALEDGSAAHLFPNPAYRWNHYPESFALEDMRARLKDIDEYMANNSQRNWAEREHGNHIGTQANNPGNPIEVFTAPPDLSRLPDNAVLALFQELDILYVNPP